MFIAEHKLPISIALLCLFLVLGASPAAGEGAPGWKLVLEKNGIAVWTRPGGDSGFQDFIGMTVIPAPVSSVEEVIENVPASPLWVPDCTEARVIRTINPSTRMILFVTQAPWPLSDREALVSAHKKKDPKTGEVTIRLRAVHDPSVPLGKGRVRIPRMQGQWVLAPVNGMHTRVTYALSGDPGGFLPSSLARLVSRKIPYNTLLGLRFMVLGPQGAP